MDADIIIIGAGSGGLSVAAGAAQMGARVILIEAHRMGGDCLNYGCVPSKALLAAAKAAHAPAAARALGVDLAAAKVAFPAVKAHVARVIAAIEPNDSVERFEGFGVEVIQGRAVFTGPDQVSVNGRTLTAKRFVIAAGSRAFIPPIPGLADVPYLTNETIFPLQERPDHLIVIGGGPIGVEMAQAHRRLGSAVSVIERGSLLAKDDPALVDVLRTALTDEGVALHEQADIASVHGSAGAITVTLKDGRTIAGSHILVATGRAPNVDSLGLEAAGVAFGPRGIQVDARRRTSNRRIFAIGDVREGPQFTHAAGYEAGIVVQNILFRLPAKVDYAALPWVTYTDPELAHVGLTEAEARSRHGDALSVLEWSFKENDRAQAERRTEGRARVYVVKGKPVGASIVGLNAGELIQTWALAISAGIKIRQIASMIAPYPTLGEVSKRAAGSAFTATLFSAKTRKLVRLLLKLP